MAFFFELIFGALAIGGFFDAFVARKQKDIISGYLFGIDEVRTGDLERSSIRGLLSVISLEERISIKRVILYSVILSVFLWLLAFYQFKSYSGPDGYNFSIYGLAFYSLSELSLLDISILIFIYLCFSFSLDYYSLFVTNKLYNFYRFKNFTFLVDITVSFLPYLAIAFVFSMVLADPEFGTHFGSLEQALSSTLPGAFAASLLGSFLLSAIQLTVVLIGLFMRGIAWIFRLNQFVFLNTNAAQIPFTYSIAVLSILLFCALKAITYLQLL